MSITIIHVLQGFYSEGSIIMNPKTQIFSCRSLNLKLICGTFSLLIDRDAGFKSALCLSLCFAFASSRASVSLCPCEGSFIETLARTPRHVERLDFTPLSLFPSFFLLYSLSFICCLFLLFSLVPLYYSLLLSMPLFFFPLPSSVLLSSCSPFYSSLSISFLFEPYCLISPVFFLSLCFLIFFSRSFVSHVQFLFCFLYLFPCCSFFFTHMLSSVFSYSLPKFLFSSYIFLICSTFLLFISIFLFYFLPISCFSACCCLHLSPSSLPSVLLIFISKLLFLFSLCFVLFPTLYSLPSLLMHPFFFHSYFHLYPPIFPFLCFSSSFLLSSSL